MATNDTRRSAYAQKLRDPRELVGRWKAYLEATRCPTMAEWLASRGEVD